ncbi:MAG: hypothetical protein QM487_14695 [Candidatus Marithrix sp.]
MVEIVGEINVEPKHVGQEADILVIASIYDILEIAPLFLMLDDREQVQLWNGNLGTLIGIEEDITLPQTQIIEIFHGFLNPINLQIYFGYRLKESGSIYFNGEQPIKVKIEEELEYSANNSILFSDLHPDGQSLVTALTDGMVRLWDINNGSRLAILHGHTDTVKTAMFSPDGSKIITALDDNTARIWDVATNKELTVLQGHTGQVEHTSFSLDGQYIVTASVDNTARIWNADGEMLSVLRRP